MEQLTDQALLAEITRTDGDENVRRSALRSIIDKDIRAEVIITGIATGRSAGPEFEQAVRRLVSIYRRHPQGFVLGKGGEAVKELRSIGAMLNDQGGITLMRAAHAAFASGCGVQGASRNLEFIWDGIGEWHG